VMEDQAANSFSALAGATALAGAPQLGCHREMSNACAMDDKPTMLRLILAEALRRRLRQGASTGRRRGAVRRTAPRMMRIVSARAAWRFVRLAGCLFRFGTPNDVNRIKSVWRATVH
jgi:hypothetical protein